jgi:hypothetical protein
MSVNIPETYNGFMLQTDSIKVIKANGHTSYIFPVKLSNPRALTFQNLTIDESASGTTSFINTYTPTKKWVEDWKAGKAGKFDGSIGVTYLSGSPAQPNNHATTSSYGKISSANFPNALGVAEAETCNTTTYYFDLPYNCASGVHEPGQAGCVLVGDERAGIAHISFDVTVCTGTGGSGGTTPIPPPDYDPCKDLPPPPLPTVSNTFNGATGLRLMVREDPPCPPDNEDLPPLVIPDITDQLDNYPCAKALVAQMPNMKVDIAAKGYGD